jgi:hypothetical protein
MGEAKRRAQQWGPEEDAPRLMDAMAELRNAILQCVTSPNDALKLTKEIGDLMLRDIDKLMACRLKGSPAADPAVHANEVAEFETRRKLYGLDKPPVQDPNSFLIVGH